MPKPRLIQTLCPICQQDKLDTRVVIDKHGIKYHNWCHGARQLVIAEGLTQGRRG